MSTLAQMRTKILAKLNDPDGDRFSEAQIDSALQDALTEYNHLRPYALTGDILSNGDRDIPCTAVTDTILLIFKAVLDDGSDEGDNLAFYATQQADSWYIHVNKDIESGKTITLHYTRPHTIEDLDSATETTVWDEDALALGASGFALTARATSTTESINLNPQVADNLLKIGEKNLALFRNQLSKGIGAGYATWA